MPKVTCLQGQRLLIGQQIGLTIKAIYKKRDGLRCVQLEIETPAGMLVFQERVEKETTQKVIAAQPEQGVTEVYHDNVL